MSSIEFMYQLRNLSTVSYLLNVNELKNKLQTKIILTMHGTWDIGQGGFGHKGYFSKALKNLNEEWSS